MLEFLAMGGYAAYVWPSWLTGVALIVGITLFSRRKLARAQQKLTQLTTLSEQERETHG